MLTRNTRRLITGIVAFLAGCAIIYVGDGALGTRVELWWGLNTFDYIWMVDMFLVPLLSGIAVAVIFGLGGKWLCYLPPLVMRLISYVSLVYWTAVPAGAQLLPVPLWILVVILAVEAAVFGGVIGEVVVKRTYGRLARELVYRQKGERGSAESKG